MEILYFIIGLLLGAGAAAIVTRCICAASSRRQIQESEIRQQELRREYEARQEEAHRNQRLEFRTIADELIRSGKTDLQTENSRQINELLSPLQSDIRKFKESVTRYYENETRDKNALIREIAILSQRGKEVGEEARRLTQALSGSTSAQGRWGEIVLETLLSHAGLVKGRDFVTQTGSDAHGSLRDDDNRAQRPDVIVELPERHRIVIDSKVSLTAFIQLESSQTHEQQDEIIRKHVSSVKKHVDELSRKQYHKYVEGAMEHTLMFIPNDSAYIAAITADNSLWEYAYSRNVVIVSSTHLLSVLQMIRQLWRVENQNRNAEQIAKLGGLIYDKLANFLQDFEAVHTASLKTIEAWKRCEAHITDARVGLKARATRLKDLGSKTTKSIPE